MGRPRRHHDDLLARVEVAVDDADVGDDAAVGVVDGVEDHRPGGGVGVTGRGRDLRDDRVEQRLDALTGLARHAQAVLGLAADELGELLGILLRLGGRQVDLVEHGDDRQLVLHGQVEVGQGLRLDALGGVDEQHGALARGERARHLVGEVDVARGVDHVEAVGRGVTRGVLDRPRHAHGLALDRDAALALDVHAVEVLRAHRAGVDDPRLLEHPVGQRRLAVVDVGDDAEVADEVRRRCVGRQRSTGHGRHGGANLAGWGVWVGVDAGQAGPAPLATGTVSHAFPVCRARPDSGRAALRRGWGARRAAQWRPCAPNPC